MQIVTLLGSIILVNTLSIYPLIREFAQRSHASSITLLQCNSSESVELFRLLSANFSGSIRSVELDPSNFVEHHQRLMAAEHLRLSLVLELNCPRVVEVMNFCSVNGYFNASYRWLMISRSSLKGSLDLLSKQILNIDTRVTLAVLDSRKKQHSLFEVYGTIHRRGGQLEVMQVGIWKEREGVVWNCSSERYSIRSNFKGITLWTSVTTIGIPKNQPLLEYLLSLEPPRNYVANRLGYRAILLLSAHLNFSVKYIKTSEWGLDIIGTNSTKGVIGQLQQNMVDFSTTPLALATERLGSFDQTIELVTRRIMTLFRHPKLSGTRNIFLQPFHNWLWFGILAILLVSACVLLLAFYNERQRGLLENCHFILVIIGFFCQQGYSGSPSIYSSRFIMITMLLFCITVYQFYSCFIIGALLVLPPKNIRTLDQLLASNLKMSIEEVAYNRDYFNRTKRPIILQLYERKILPNEYGFVNVSLGTALVKQGGHAFHCDTSYVNTWIMETFTDYEICELQEIELYPIRPLHMVLPKGSPLKEPFRVLGAPHKITMDNYLSLTEPAKNYVANRLGYRTVKLLGVLLNFRVVHILTTEWGFDVVGTNSTKGIIGQLQQNLVDLSSAPLAITSERMQSFDQTIDLVTRRIITIFRHPKNGGSRNIFLHPFQNMLWLGIDLVLLFSSGFLLFSCFVKRQRSQGRCSNFLLLIFGFFCQQSYAGSTTISPSRMVLLTMLLFSLTVYQFYSCFIIGYLLVLPTKNIRSIEQLIESNLGFSIEDVPYNRDYFNRTKNPLARELYEKKVLNSDVGFINVSLGVDLIKRGKHAFHCDTSYVNTWIMDSFSDYEQCELQEIETYPTRPLQIVIPKGSPLKEPFWVSIRLMMDTGLVQYYRRKFFMKRPPCSTDSFATVKVGFWDIASLYWLLVAGFTMSAFVLAVEILEFRVRMHFWDKEFSKHYTGWHN